MAITPTQFAKKTAQCEIDRILRFLIISDLATAANWSEAKRRVLSSYREWIRGVRQPSLYPTENNLTTSGHCCGLEGKLI